MRGENGVKGLKGAEIKKRIKFLAYGKTQAVGLMRGKKKRGGRDRRSKKKRFCSLLGIPTWAGREGGAGRNPSSIHR